VDYTIISAEAQTPVRTHEAEKTSSRDMAIMPASEIETERRQINVRRVLLVVLALLVSCALVVAVFGQTAPPEAPQRTARAQNECNAH